MLLAVSFLTAFAVTWLIVRSERRHAHLSNDHDLSGVQKFHTTAVPRIGGVGIFIGVLAVVLLATDGRPGVGRSMLVLVGCSLPAFLAGLVEDFTKRVSPSQRMLFTAVAALLAMGLLGAMLAHIDVPVLDWLVIWPIEAAALTVFTVCGVTNSINLIDGFNGLASMCVMLILLGLAWVGWRVHDPLITQLSLAVVGATLGFFLLNFPRGRIFLGDGGAYFLGFMTAELAILLLARNPGVSSIFPLMVCAYPIVETVFTIYRRRFVHRTAAGQPDAMHLHHLVFKRLTRRGVDRADTLALTRRNSMTSPWLWAMCALAVVPAICFWDRSDVLGACLLVYVVIYTLAYRQLARFRVPRWLSALRR